MVFKVFCWILFRSEEICALSEDHESWDVLGCHEQHAATLSNLGMVQALNVRCVHRTISRTTLLSTACLVQKGAQHLMVPPHMQVANVKLASSSKKMESWNLIEQKIWPQLDFCHAWCLLAFWWCFILTGELETAPVHSECQKGHPTVFTMFDGRTCNTYRSGSTWILLSLYGYQCFLDSFQKFSKVCVDSHFGISEMQ